MEAIQATVSSGLSVEPWVFLEVGQRVRLQEGPLAGVEGIFVGEAKQERIVVSVTLLKRSMAVAIERHWAAPVVAGTQRAVFHAKPAMTESSAYV